MLLLLTHDQGNPTRGFHSDKALPKQTKRNKFPDSEVLSLTWLSVYRSGSMIHIAIFQSFKMNTARLEGGGEEMEKCLP